MASAPGKEWTEAEEDTIRRLYNAGESGAAIARELGDRSPSSVNTRIRKMREAGTLALPLVEALADEAEAMDDESIEVRAEIEAERKAAWADYNAKNGVVTSYAEQNGGWPPVGMTPSGEDFANRDASLCRPGMEHQAPCGETGDAYYCACGCAADETWCMADEGSDPMSYADYAKTMSYADYAKTVRDPLAGVDEIMVSVKVVPPGIPERDEVTGVVPSYSGPIAFVQPERIRVGQIILDAMGAPVRVIAVDVAEAHPDEDPEREDSPGVDIITLSGIHHPHIDSGHIPGEATWHISLPAGTLTEVAICGYTPPGSRRSCGVNPGHKDQRIGHCYSVSHDDLGFFRDSADVVDGVAEAVPA